MDVPPWFLAGVAFLYGAATGSFLGVIIDRVPESRSIGGRSHCVCGRRLSWWENVPVASWILLRGRGRCCGASIPMWYLAIEVGLGVAFAAASLLPLPLVVRVMLAALVASTVAAAGLRLRRRQIETAHPSDHAT